MDCTSFYLHSLTLSLVYFWTGVVGKKYIADVITSMGLPSIPNPNLTLTLTLTLTLNLTLYGSPLHP